MRRTAVPIVARLGPLGHPARLTVIGFLVMNIVGALVLMLPVSSRTGDWTGLITALFTATSAVCVTGLVVVDTATYWSPLGQAVVLGLIQIGGLGIMTAASLLGLLVARRMGLRMQLIAQAETKTLRLGETRRVVRGVLAMSLVIEVVVAAVLAARRLATTSESFGSAVYYGVFHAISAYNNAGFALHEDSLVRHATDAWTIVPITVAFMLGGIRIPGGVRDDALDRRPPPRYTAAGLVAAHQDHCAHLLRTAGGRDHAGDRAGVGQPRARPASIPSTWARCIPPRCWSMTR